MVLNWVTVAPFVFVAVGVVLRTFVPLIVKNLELIKDGKEPESFRGKYLLAPLATVALTLIGFAMRIITEIGFIQEIAKLSWQLAILVGIGMHDAIREVQKMVFERKRA